MNRLLEPPPLSSRRRCTDRRLLLVAYAFPPVGGAGVQRPVKWVKYLQRAGWQVTVLTPENPSVPVLDHSLAAEIPDSVVMLRPRTWEPGYHLKQQLGQSPGRSGPRQWLKAAAKRVASLVLQPDPQILWYRPALRAAIDHLRSTPHDAILVTAPPYSSCLIGAALKQRFGLPLLLDFRDEWDLSSQYLEHAQRDWVSRSVQERMQQQVLSQADAVIATTRASARRLEQRLHDLGRDVPSVCIYNGYDAEDFAEVRGRKTEFRSQQSVVAADGAPFSGTLAPVIGGEGRGEGAHVCTHPLPLTLAPADGVEGTGGKRFRLVYTGTLWNLTSIAPVVTALEQAPQVAAQVELVCVGRKTPEQLAILNRLQQTACRLVNIDYCDHTRALEWLHSADALCLLLSAGPGAERVVPAKLFEYLATRKEMLAVLPWGEAADIVREFQPRNWFAPEDTAGIAAWLQQAVQRHAAGLRAPAHLPREIRQYSREQQTNRLIDLLEELTAFPARPQRLRREERAR